MILNKFRFNKVIGKSWKKKKKVGLGSQELLFIGLLAKC